MRGPHSQICPITAGAAQLFVVMRARGWSQRALARLLGWSLTRLHRVLNGEGRPTVTEAFEVQDLTDGEVSARAWTVALQQPDRGAA